jgi:hypothetical protein
MFKLIKKWMDDWNTLNKELNNMGMYFHVTAYGSWIQYIDPPQTKEINTTDDTSRKIPRSNR